MRDEFPDPSVVSSIDFYSSAFRIKRLLRRRGWHDVIPMGGKPYGFMPREYYEAWQKFSKRGALIRKRGGGNEFERFVAQIICQYYCNPATFSNKILDLAPGGDFDVLVEGPGEALFYLETKTSHKKSKKSTSVASMWNFMVREAQLSADMSVFLYDSNQNFQELLIPIFEILFSLTKYVGVNVETRDITHWVARVEAGNFERIARQIGKKELYFLYWPVAVTAGGDEIKDNIGETISLYYGGIRYVSPFERLGGRPTREVFLNIPNWKELPKEIKKHVSEKKIISWAESAVKRDKEKEQTKQS